MIPIERVKVGMLAWALDVETGEWGYCEIVNTFESRSGDFLVRVEAGGGALTVTPDHPFWVLDGTSTHSGEWSAAAELGVGDLLLSSEGGPVTVTTVSESAGGVAVYNFEVRGAHTYFVGGRGVLVHNACDESLTGDSGGGSVGNEIETPHAQAFGGNKTAGAPKTEKPNSIHEQIRPDGSRSVTYYDEKGRAFSREDYGQLKTHGVLGKGVDGKSVPHEHRVDYSDQGPIGKWYWELDANGMPVGPWHKD